MRSPRRLSRPTTRERRRPRIEPSDRPVSFKGIWTRRPSARIAMATWRRFRPSNRPKIGLPHMPGRSGRFAQSTRRSVIMQPSSGRWSRGAPPRTSESRPRVSSRRPAIGLGPRWADRWFALADPRSARASGLRLSRDRRLPDGLFPTNWTLELRATHFQRCPASRTMAELATADRTRRTRKA